MGVKATYCYDIQLGINLAEFFFLIPRTAILSKNDIFKNIFKTLNLHKM